MTAATGETRRIELSLHRPWFALFAGIRPTLVRAGLGQPVQEGRGTWQVHADETVVIGFFLFTRLGRSGQAEFTLRPEEPPTLISRATALPFLRGRMHLG